MIKIFARLSSTNFTWSILEYFVPYITTETEAILTLSCLKAIIDRTKSIEKEISKHEPKKRSKYLKK